KSLADGCGFCQNRKILRPCTFRLPLVKNHTSEVSNAGLGQNRPKLVLANGSSLRVSQENKSFFDEV
ncbi:MAG: hypothetical protein FWE04_08765, partial [Oscillospiraceae bacterium]|nr:hypothetical protein [Oscillospiraceae bacterium]